MLRAIDISTTGLIAQRQRMNTIAGNIANAYSPIDPSGKAPAYERRLVRLFADEQHASDRHRPVGVRFQVEIDPTEQPRKVFDKGHPLADQDGYVSYPGINMVTEFVNAMEAARAYEANVGAIDISKQMTNLSLRILA